MAKTKEAPTQTIENEPVLHNHLPLMMQKEPHPHKRSGEVTQIPRAEHLSHHFGHLGQNQETASFDPYVGSETQWPRAVTVTFVILVLPLIMILAGQPSALVLGLEEI